MAVSAEYLAKVRLGVRRSQSTDVDSELKDLVEECRQDLVSVGVTESKATDETDYLILGAVRSFARWKFGMSNDDADKNKADYLDQKDELRRKTAYITEA